MRLRSGFLAAVEVKDKHLSRAGFGLEAALVARSGGVEVVRAFGEILLLLLVILADEEAAVLYSDGQDDVRGKGVFTGEAVKLVGPQRDALVLLQLGQRRELVVGRVAVPVERKGCLAEKRLDQWLEDALAVRTVGHHQHAVAVQEA
jgi:hypothetical protein